MSCEDSRGWSETHIGGLHIRADGAFGMRLLGWEGVLPLSVIEAVVVEPTTGGLSALAPSPADMGLDDRDGIGPEFG
ncbi:hypothetical protein ABZ484_17215 [Streptomyces sp. NPDC006393]|uniref:hypothetical protein n=1 Tax=Streptomyces sp. NPDC006393 TaxID=3156763 RepID=UPI0033D0FEA7